MGQSYPRPDARVYGRALINEVIEDAEAPSRFGPTVAGLDLDPADAIRVVELAEWAAAARRTGNPAEFVDRLRRLRNFARILGVNVDAIENAIVRG
jgi:hypothetical protein